MDRAAHGIRPIRARATVLATGGVPATAFTGQGHLLMPYVIATKANVGTIQAYQRW